MVDFVLSKGKRVRLIKRLLNLVRLGTKSIKFKSQLLTKNVRTRFRNDYDLSSKPPTEKKPNYSSVQWIVDYKGTDDIVLLRLTKDAKSTKANALRMFATIEK